VRAGSGDAGFQGDGTVAILRLQQPLWTGGRLTAGVRRAEAEVRANEAAASQVGQQLALRVVQAYGDWLAARLKMLAWERSHGVHTRLLSQVERRIEQGVSAESDVKLAIARLESLAADMAVARLQQQTALARLSQVVGRPGEAALLQASPAAPRPVQGTAGELVAAALARDPATQAARAQVEAQEAVVAERRAALSPEVFLRLEQQHGDHAVRNAPAQGRVFVGLSTSLGAGLSSLSQVDAARQLQIAAQERVAAQEREVTELVLADHALATAARERLAALEKSLAATQEVAASYDRQFLAGRRTWLDVMNAARELAQTEVQLTDLQASLVVASWRLAILAQGLPR
jgi:adhesin transport system outer membrane protein